MLRFVNYDIVFQEIPDEITLAINISNCPNCCKGCHSPYLMDNIGEILNENTLLELVNKYNSAISCVCFMGGDAEPNEIEHLAKFLQKTTNKTIKTGWYSGKDKLPTKCSIQNFNYIKLGAYIKELGGLSSSTTNQRLYKIEGNSMIDITHKFNKIKIIR
jgi:anaerobic ribonucleoside-triphosphate reductase activating protein